MDEKRLYCVHRPGPYHRFLVKEVQPTDDIQNAMIQPATLADISVKLLELRTPVAPPYGNLRPYWGFSTRYGGVQFLGHLPNRAAAMELVRHSSVYLAGDVIDYTNSRSILTSLDVYIKRETERLLATVL